MKIFVTGATGYIGGTLAHQLVAAGHAVTGLARTAERGAALAAAGITPVIGTLDDVALLAEQAGRADAVVNAAHADHRASVEALLGALRGTHKAFVHTSGAGIVADCAGGAASDAVYDEDTPVHPLPLRVPRVQLIDFILAANGEGVRASVVAPPMVYGTGTGLHRDSMQIPMMARDAAASGAARYVGAGENRWSHVHVEDLGALYVRILESAAPGQLYYAEYAELSMREIASAIHRALGLPGEARSMSVEDAIQVHGEVMATYSFGSNCRVRARHAREQLGWLPKQPGLAEWIATELRC